MHNKLIAIYEKLRNNIMLEEKLRTEESVLLKIVGKRKNKIAELLEKSAVTINIMTDDINLLEKEGYIKILRGDRNKAILTAHGIYLIERGMQIINEKKLIDFFQDKYFPKYKFKLDGTDKVTVLSLFAIRAFDESVAMELKCAEVMMDRWLKLFRDGRAFLEENRIVSEQDLNKIDEQLNRKEGNEHPISYIMRRRNELPQRTNQIYKYNRNERKYYLAIVESGIFNKQKAINIVKQILGDKKDEKVITGMIKYCTNQADKKGISLVANHKYLTMEIEDKVRNTVIDAI